MQYYVVAMHMTLVLLTMHPYFTIAPDQPVANVRLWTFALWDARASPALLVGKGTPAKKQAWNTLDAFPKNHAVIFRPIMFMINFNAESVPNHGNLPPPRHEWLDNVLFTLKRYTYFKCP